MEDQMLWEDGPEEDFINLVEHGYSKSLFAPNALALLGMDWHTRGLAILKDRAPELVAKFQGLTKDAAD